MGGGVFLKFTRQQYNLIIGSASEQEKPSVLPSHIPSQIRFLPFTEAAHKAWGAPGGIDHLPGAILS